MSDFKKEFNKVEEEGKGRVAKRFFGLTFDEVKDNKDIDRRCVSAAVAFTENHSQVVFAS